MVRPYPRFVHVRPNARRCDQDVLDQRDQPGRLVCQSRKDASDLGNARTLCRGSGHFRDRDHTIGGRGPARCDVGRKNGLFHKRRCVQSVQTGAIFGRALILAMI